ncbi:hypothetical protein [Neobacillus piezotolerans]|uniref:hypothetical protein n=1 Tax=Neobacillus piezotolerans TaxID=2259171 RepID=UPI00115AED37|nr:hypothetical protein [Neobacillus piezotolerans]
MDPAEKPWQVAIEKSLLISTLIKLFYQKISRDIKQSRPWQPFPPPVFGHLLQGSTGDACLWQILLACISLDFE